MVWKCPILNVLLCDQMLHFFLLFDGNFPQSQARKQEVRDFFVGPYVVDV